jgi:Domain of unknown function (DUF5916)/Carbohydrate family 9 binding domain-like
MIKKHYFMITKINTVLLLLLFLFLSGASQNILDFQEKFKLNISKANSKIKIDGLLDEAAWESAGQTSDFWKKWPNDVGRPVRQTYVKMSYDDQFLYIGIKAIDTNYYVVQSLKRDQGFFMSDAVTIAIDPVNQRTNGFLFSITPYNVQSEDLVASGQSNGELSFSWDNKWISATSRHPNYWIAEIAIPFKTLRFKEGKTKWGINFLRTDVKNNEFSSWTKMPTNFPFFDFGYAGSLNWNTPPPAPGTNISTIPYVSSFQSSDKEANVPWTGKLNGGFDSKIALTSSLNLDLNVNPDFSQVEADQQVTNLTRFDIFFPEKRTFFLENDDLFSNFGIPPIRPFYSRTIGLDKNGNKIPIAAGVRISGNVSKKTRIGLMNMQTLAKNDAAAQNYTAITFNEQVQARSSIKGYFLNRQGLEDKDHRFTDPLDRYGRNAGIEYNFLDNSGKWNAWSGHHLSFKDGIKTPGYYTNTGGGYSSKKWNFVVDYTQITDKYYADMGFISHIENYDALLGTVTRLGYKQIYNQIKHTFYPKKGKITQIKLGLGNIIFLNPNLSFNQSIHDLTLEFSFKNTSSLIVGSSFDANNLLFNTSFTDKLPIPPGKYRAATGYITYGSDIKKKISYTLLLNGGNFFNGSIFQYDLITKYRIQPWGNFGFSFQQARLAFPEKYGSSNLFLIAPRIEINFSNNLSWSTFLQYNNQRNNFNINSKIQWRYKPMSDIFLVYSDNYFTDPLMKNKNRALVFKMNYWLNL